MTTPTLEEARRYKIPDLERYIGQCERNQGVLETAVFDEIKNISRARQMIKLLEESGDGP